MHAAWWMRHQELRDTEGQIQISKLSTQLFLHFSIRSSLLHLICWSDTSTAALVTTVNPAGPTDLSSLFFGSCWSEDTITVKYCIYSTSFLLGQEAKSDGKPVHKQVCVVDLCSWLCIVLDCLECFSKRTELWYLFDGLPCRVSTQHKSHATCASL